MSDNPQNGAYIEVDLRDDGLLWLFNTTALHPHGLALSLDTETRGLRLMVFDSEEAVVFDDDTAQEGHQKFRAAVDRLNLAAKQRADERHGE